MRAFFINIKCELGQAYNVANAIADSELASEIYSTAGHFDLLVKLYLENDADVGHFVHKNIHTIKGVKDTETLVTFRAF